MILLSKFLPGWSIFRETTRARIEFSPGWLFFREIKLRQFVQLRRHFRRQFHEKLIEIQIKVILINFTEKLNEVQS